MNNLIYVVDIETDHLDCDVGSIVEIGIVLFSLDTKKIYCVFSSLIQEGKSINPDAWIFKNSSLKYEEVSKAKFLSEIFYVLQEIFSQGVFTSFNQKFDFAWLESRGFKIGNIFYDPMVVLTPIMKLSHVYYGFKFPSVEEAYYFLFHEYVREDHRALSDAFIEAKIVREMSNRGYFNEV